MMIKDFHPPRLRTRAFTLVELLVVVSIIALLIAILLPSLRKAREQAKRTKCYANLHAIHIALICYADDNRQELPSYSTMGEWGFRVAPGVRVIGGKVTTNRQMPPESFGVQRVLHTGTGPEILPNMMAKYEVGVKPLYLDGNSDVWVCPSNKGPKGDNGTHWNKFGNTYFYRCNKGGQSDYQIPGDPSISPDPKRNYNIDYLNRNARAGNKSPLVWDNYMFKPANSARARPDGDLDGWKYDVEDRRAPHCISKSKDSDVNDFWCAAYADGHVQMNAMNKN